MTCLLLRDDIQSSAFFSLFLFSGVGGEGGGSGGGGGGGRKPACCEGNSQEILRSSSVIPFSIGILKAPSINVRRENGKVAESSLV